MFFDYIDRFLFYIITIEYMVNKKFAQASRKDAAVVYFMIA